MGYFWTLIGLSAVIALVIVIGRVDFHRSASKQDGANPELARAAHEAQRQIDQGKGATRGFF